MTPLSWQVGEQYFRRLPVDATEKPVPHSGQVRSNSEPVQSTAAPGSSRCA